MSSGAVGQFEGRLLGSSGCRVAASFVVTLICNFVKQAGSAGKVGGCGRRDSSGTSELGGCT